MILFPTRRIAKAGAEFEVTEDVHHQAIALRFPCRDNELKGRAQRACPWDHLIAETVVLGV
jgi:hypothetical protein